MAGVGGFEPPHGGIKIRCLTTWLHPKKETAKFLSFHGVIWLFYGGVQGERRRNCGDLLPSPSQEKSTKGLGERLPSVPKCSTDVGLLKLSSSDPFRGFSRPGSSGFETEDSRHRGEPDCFSQRSAHASVDEGIAATANSGGPTKCGSGQSCVHDLWRWRCCNREILYAISCARSTELT